MSMILRAVGFEHVRNYEASIYEWSADPNMPMETGEYKPQ
jgi:3-mercaptopyruvate sulfurtransferase SseA